jgi:hypothetical protein
MRSIFLALVALILLATPALADPNWTFKNCGITSMSGSSTQLSAANALRHYLLICNFGAAGDNITLGMAGETAVANQGLNLVPGACKEYASGTSYLPQPPANAINVIGTSGQPVSCYEGR